MILCMESLFILMSIVLGFVFPYALITAIRTEDESKRSFHTILSCLCFGIIVFTLFGL